MPGECDSIGVFIQLNIYELIWFLMILRNELNDYKCVSVEFPVLPSCPMIWTAATKSPSATGTEFVFKIEYFLDFMGSDKPYSIRVTKKLLQV